MTGGRSGDCNDFRGKITTRAGTCGRGVERETKDLLLSAVRNDLFLTADNNKSILQNVEFQIWSKLYRSYVQET